MISKFKCNEISGNLLNFFEKYLLDRYQRVILNEVNSSLRTLNAGIPRGSVLSPVFFLVYINDFTENISEIRLLADDSSMFIRGDGIDSAQEKREN